MALVLMSPYSSAGASNNWSWGAGGFWRYGTNWTLDSATSTHVAPSTNTTKVTIANGGVAKTVIIDPGTPTTNLTILGLVINGGGGSTRSNWLVVSNLTSAAPFTILDGARIGGTPAARFVVTNSTVILDGKTGGELVTSNGVIILQPYSSMLLSNGIEAKFGVGNPGTLNMSSNTSFIVADTNFVVGHSNGAGTVTCNGGNIFVGETFTIGLDSTSTGFVYMAAGTLTANNTNANTQIAQFGDGTLTVSNGICRFDDVSVGRHIGAIGKWNIYGGTNYTSDVSVGRFTNATGFLTIGGGQLLMSGDLLVGREGTGTVSMTAGYLQAQDIFLGASNASYGTMTFAGGTSVISSSVVIGTAGSSGLLTISNGLFLCTNAANTGLLNVVKGSLVMRGGTSSWDSILLTNTGSLTITGGLVNVDQITVSNGAPFVIGNGSTPVTVRLTGGGSSFYNGLVVNTNATLIGSGAINGAVTNRGTISADGNLLAFTGVIVNEGGATNGVNGGTLRVGSGRTNAITRIQRSAGVTQLTITTTNATYYTIEAKQMLTDPLWTPLWTILGSNTPVLFNDYGTGDSAQRYYRVKVQ